MGRDKALLPYEGVTLLAHALDILRGATPDVRILSGPSRRYLDFGVPVIEDPICGAGPLGGLYAALNDAAGLGINRVLWLAVDLPLVPSPFLRDLADGLEAADVAMARTERGVEPLCAAFRTVPTLDTVRDALLNGRLKLTAALAGLRIREIEAPASLFKNLNTPADWAGMEDRSSATEP